MIFVISAQQTFIRSTTVGSGVVTGVAGSLHLNPFAVSIAVSLQTTAGEARRRKRRGARQHHNNNNKGVKRISPSHNAYARSVSDVYTSHRLYKLALWQLATVHVKRQVGHDSITKRCEKMNRVFNAISAQGRTPTSGMQARPLLY